MDGKNWSRGAGVQLVDFDDDTLFDRLNDGDAITIRGGDVLRGNEIIAHGVVQDPSAVRARNDQAKAESHQDAQAVQVRLNVCVVHL